MLKYKVIYGKCEGMDFDGPKDEFMILFTPDNVGPEDIASMLLHIYDYVTYMIYVWNEEHKGYDRIEMSSLKFRPIQLNDIIATNEFLKSHRLKEETKIKS